MFKYVVQFTGGVATHPFGIENKFPEGKTKKLVCRSIVLTQFSCLGSRYILPGEDGKTALDRFIPFREDGNPMSV